MIEQWGNYGYQLGAAGILVFTAAFLLTVRFWTDTLGRVIATVLITMSGVLVMSTLRMLHVELPGGLLNWRAVVFWLFGAGVWSGIGVFVWAQFLAPRIKRVGRMTTRREYRNESQSRMGDVRGSRDGDSDDRAGSIH